jgi:hypothetical protein
MSGLHGASQRAGCRGAEDQMNVIRHQAICPDAYPFTVAGALQEGLVELVVLRREERSLPSVPTLGDVMWDSRNDTTSDTWHDTL